VKVVVAATSDVAIPTLNWLFRSENQLIRIVSTPDSRSGRGQLLKESPISKWADENSLPLEKPNTVEEMEKAFTGADLVLVIAYGKIIPEKLLSIPTHGFLNLHFSLLPAYRGAAPVQRAIKNGENVTGVSIFRIERDIDTGPIFVQQKYVIPQNANSGYVLQELAKIGPSIFQETFAALSKGVLPKPQPTEGVSYAPKVTKEDAYINWFEPSEKILNAIRAFTPNPGAWTMFRGATLKISDAQAYSGDLKLLPGNLHVGSKTFLVGTNDSPIEIAALVPPGKREMSASEWINGARISPGEIFE